MTALTTRSLTELQQRFVDNILDGLPPVRAAELAGIASPRTHATRYVHNIHVQRAIMEGLTKRLAMEGAPLAYNLLVKVVSDDAVSSRVRVDAAKALLDRAGFVPPKASDPVDATEKDLSKMSRDELKAFVASAENKLAREAIDVTPAAEDLVGIMVPQSEIR